MDNQNSSNFPAWFYGPNGESQIFEREEDIPKGWKDHPNKFAKEAKSDVAVKEKTSTGKTGGKSEATTPVLASEDKSSKKDSTDVKVEEKPVDEPKEENKKK